MRFQFIARYSAAAAALFISTLALSQSTGATFERYGSVSVSASNQGAALPGGGLYFVNEDESGTVTDGSFFSYFSSLTYEGYDSSNDLQEMTFEGTGYAQGDYGVIRTRYEGGLYNSFFSENNPYLYNSQTREYDSYGTPDVIQGVAQAGWVDQVQYGGTATGYMATYVFRITGKNENFKSFSLLDINVGESGSQRFTFFQTGVTDQIVRTTPVFIGQDGLRTTVDMTSIFQPNMRELADGSDFFGDSNFASTVQLVGIELRDSNGDLVTDVPLFGASGTNYQPVPEPGVVALLGGLGILLGRRMTKKA